MITVPTIINTAIVVVLIIVLISMIVVELICNNRRKKEILYNSLLPEKITFINTTGFIQAKYSFGRFYVHYECINENGERFYKTISLNNDGSTRERYSKQGWHYGFENSIHSEVFYAVKSQVKSIIANINNHGTI